MLHHAAQVSKRTPLTRTLSPDVWPCSAFTTVLRTAAARAWTRTAVRHLRTVSVSTSVNSEKENTSRTEPLSGVPSDINFGSFLNERKKFAARSSSSAWGDDDPLVDPGGSSAKATQPSTRSITLTRPTTPSTLPKPCAQQVNHPTVHNPQISPETTEIRSRTPFQKPRRHLPYLRGLASLPDSTSSLDLLNNLDKWRRRPPKPTITSFLSESPKRSPKLNFEALHAYHALFPAFQTHRSFRVLAEIAIHEAKFDSVRLLWIEMDRKGMLGDWDSLDDGGVSLWAVWVRWMVRRGKWLEAWTRAQKWRVKMAKLSASQLASEGLPHAIWIEFMGKAHNSVERPPPSVSESQNRSRLTNGERPNTRDVVEDGDLGLEERHKLLMRQPPHRNHSQITNVRPRTIYTLVRARLRLRDREWSLGIIRSWFEKMGSKKAATDTKGNRACLRLLHLYLTLAFPLPNGQQQAGPVAPKGFASVREMEAVVDELVKLNPRVTPNSTTVLLLLRHLRQTSKCADNGLRLVARYRMLYGDEVEDDRVRLRLASLAIKQNNPRVFRKCLARSSSSGEVRWKGVAMARRRARLMRERPQC
ncbi:hypothetical protein BJ322DRAFT_1054612 [Thelephora terrestris]|uniref:Uncharacterized protein n=1 Tax=Thelephora terrestris TaxID=56493 RepID=A0A9P6L8L2_9AGAM|nr:hypothetical protein BJ322DRAFT_1054612 [Thelephora terrestris]